MSPLQPDRVPMEGTFSQAQINYLRHQLRNRLAALEGTERMVRHALDEYAAERRKLEITMKEIGL